MNKINACKYKNECGGCLYQGVEYPKQLEIKQELTEKLLKKFGKLNPIIGAENPLNYRNKVNAAFGFVKKEIAAGTYRANSHKLVAIDDCMIQDKTATAIINDIKNLLKSFKLRPYNEDEKNGFLRHVMIRTGYATKQVLVVLVVADVIFPSKNNFVKALRKLHPEITSIVMNINNKKTSMVLGDREIVLYGKGYIEDILCGKRFKISPKSFYQVNPKQTEIMYTKALEFADLKGNERVIDAYCGIGTIGIIASGSAKEVLGVEINKDAFKDAIINAKMNNIKNIKFINADAKDFMLELAENNEHADVVIMDPPRAGSDEVFLKCLLRLSPDKVVYISCNPETLARDLEFLTKNNYKAEIIQPIEMFPFTEHVECVCLLSRKRKYKA